MRTIRLTAPAADVDGMVGGLLDDWRPALRIAGEATEVYREDGSLLLRYLPRAVPAALCRAAEGALTAASWDSIKNRITAVGAKRHRYVLKNGTVGRGTVVNLARMPELRAFSDSGVMGSMDRYVRWPYCRLTRFNQQHLDRFETALPVVERIARTFEEQVPDRFAAQQRWADATDPAWVIRGTPFTTVTVNINFQTAVHRDAGDLREGFGCLTAIRSGHFVGGETVLPGYDLGVDMGTGDVLLYDVHEPHGNLPLVGRPGSFRRLALVCYYRRKMVRCGSPASEAEQARTRRRGQPLYTAAELAREKGMA